MKVSYSLAKDRASPHCISWTYRKKRHRKFFRSMVDAFRFRNLKEMELGVKDREAIENEVIFLVLSEIKEKLFALEDRIFRMEESLWTSRNRCEKSGSLLHLKSSKFLKLQRFYASQDENFTTFSTKSIQEVQTSPYPYHFH